MRAAVLYGKEDVRIEEVPEPALNPGEVRIAIQAALTCGTDLKVFKRGYHAKMIQPPAVFGHELSGIISEVHPATEVWTVGERVVAANSAPCAECFFCHHGQENLCDDLLFLNGAYAESIVVPARIVERNLLRLQPGTRFADAALTEPLACVVQGLGDLALQGHERVLVIGSGPIGLMFVALARHLGCIVTLAGRGETRLKTAAALGAFTVEIGPDEELLSIISGTRRTFDVVIEATGKPAVWEAAPQLVRKGGTVNLFGGCPSGTSVRFDTGLIHYSSLKLLASFHHTPQTVRAALRLIERGVISSEQFVSGTCKLDELPKLLRMMSAGNRAVKTLILPT
jgi:L-iditol 2-dehydrogenase